MKFCPFLVAGRDLVQEHQDHEQILDAAPDSLGIPEEELDGVPAGDAAAIDDAERQPEGLARPATAGVTRDLASLECLGETCRFYDAGDCRFDRLLVSGPSMHGAPSASDALSADGEQPSLGYVLQEVWSLQRESLRELIEGFRKVEDVHSDRQGDFGARLDNISARLEEVQNAGPHPDVVSLLESRFENVTSCVGRLENSLRDVLGESDSSLQSQFDATRNAVRAAVEESRRALQETFTDVVADVSKETRDVVRDSLIASNEVLRNEITVSATQTGQSVANIQTEINQVRDDLGSVRDDLGGVRDDLGGVRDGVQEARQSTSAIHQKAHEIHAQTHALDQRTQEIEGQGQDAQRQVASVQKTVLALQDGVRQVSASVQKVQSSMGSVQDNVQTSVERTLGQLRDALQETRQSLQEMLRNAGKESRAELERSLSNVLEDNRQMRELRDQVERALDALRSDVQGVASAAAKLETSSVETRQLLGDQKRLNQDLEARDRHEESRRLNNAGVMSYHQGAYDTAIEQFRKAVDMDPTLAEAWNNLGLAQTELHKDEEALEAFRKALEIDPGVGQIYNNLGYLYHRRGELGEAVEMYERATQRGSDTSAAYSNLANALYQLDRVDDAVGAWKQALEIDPANDKASSALERLGLGAE